jgi:3-hydroxy-9,10-secoandrosta-1,3,5(10)-triene-9,17-dione monooxygenase reductase component
MESRVVPGNDAQADTGAVPFQGASTDRVTAFDEKKFRTVLGHYPTGVTLVTALHQGDPVGMIIGSFTSVSLNPPLVGFLVGKESTTWPRIAAAGSFCVNVLGHHQQEVCRLFARSSPDRFAATGWQPQRNGVPVLRDAIAWIDCDIDRVDEAGDHWWVIGRVVQLEAGGAGSPLVFVRGSFGQATGGPAA